MISYLSAFFGVAALDIVWAKYTYALTARAPWRAGIFASSIFILNGTVTIGFVSDPWLLIPAALGAFAGTAIAVRMS